MEKALLAVWETPVAPFPLIARFFCNLCRYGACLTVNDTESLDKPSSRFLSPPGADTAASGVFYARVLLRSTLCFFLYEIGIDSFYKMLVVPEVASI